MPRVRTQEATKFRRRYTAAESTGPASVQLMYSFVRQPKWMAAHVLVLLLLVTFLLAGTWQFGRHQKRIDRNDVVLDRADAVLLEIGDLFEPQDIFEFRLVQLNGSWSTCDSVLIRNRSHQDPKAKATFADAPAPRADPQSHGPLRTTLRARDPERPRR